MVRRSCLGAVLVVVLAPWLASQRVQPLDRGHRNG